MHGSTIELFQGMFGEYSLAKHLLIALLCLAVIVAVVVGIVREGRQGFM